MSDIQKLTIKDLNCANCSHKNKYSCPMIAAYAKACKSNGDKPSVNVIHKIMEYHVETIREHGCAFHPLALRVLTQPIVVDLERWRSECAQKAVDAEDKDRSILYAGESIGLGRAIKLLCGN